MSVLPAEHAFAHTNDLIDDWIPSLDGGRAGCGPPTTRRTAEDPT
jgi:hypothetical protein